MRRHWTVYLMVLLVSLIASFTALPASAGQGGWEKLGSRLVDGRLDKDVIEVGADHPGSGAEQA